MPYTYIRRPLPCRGRRLHPEGMVLLLEIEKLFYHRSVNDVSRYAEIDLVVCNNRTKNMIKNIESDTDRVFPSDHFPVHFEFKIKLAKNHERSKSKANKWKGPERPTEAYIATTFILPLPHVCSST